MCRSGSPLVDNNLLGPVAMLNQVARVDAHFPFGWAVRDGHIDIVERLGGQARLPAPAVLARGRIVGAMGPERAASVPQPSGPSYQATAACPLKAGSRSSTRTSLGAARALRAASLPVQVAPALVAVAQAFLSLLVAPLVAAQASLPVAVRSAPLVAAQAAPS